MLLLINFISFFLDGILSLFMGKDSIFLPLFTVLSLIEVYPLLKNKRKLITIGIIMGVLYDVVYTQTLFMNTIIFFLISLTIIEVFKLLSYNSFNSLLLSILLIILYRTLSYAFFFILNDVQLNLGLLFKSIYSSLLLNIIYSVLFNFVYFKLKVQDRKPDKYIHK